MFKRQGPVRVGDTPPLWWRVVQYVGATVLMASAFACVYWFPEGSRETSVTVDQAAAAVFILFCATGATLLLTYDGP